MSVPGGDSDVWMAGLGAATERDYGVTVVEYGRAFAIVITSEGCAERSRHNADREAEIVRELLRAALRAPTPGPDRLRLIEVGPRKIPVIKTIRHACGLDLSMAKDIAESAPVVLPRTYGETLADVADELTRLGARVETVSATPGPEAGERRAGRWVWVFSDPTTAAIGEVVGVITKGERMQPRAPSQGDEGR